MGGGRSSLQDADGVTWQTGSVALGTTGLDLRTPIEADALPELLNARFQDERTVLQRDGHDAQTVYDGSDIASLGGGLSVTGAWVYGSGATVSNGGIDENEHHPWPGVARGIWDHNGSQIVWTGDRVLVAREDDYFLGSSAFWNRNAAGAALRRGLPAYIPLQTDSTPSVIGLGSSGYVETCLTSTMRAVVTCVATSGFVVIDLFNRENGALVNHSTIPATAPANPRIMQSGTKLVALWMDASPGALMLSYWTGSAWSTPSAINAAAVCYEVAQVSDGFHVVWKVVNGSTDEVHVGRFVGASAASTPYAFDTVARTYSPHPVQSLAIGVAPDNSISIVIGSASAGIIVNCYTSTLTPVSLDVTVDNAGYDQFGGLAVCSRGLRNSAGEYEWLVHYKQSGGTAAACIRSYYPTAGVTSVIEQRFNTTYVSKSFRVGDEVFIWAIESSANTCYLLGGHYQAQTCGYADREVGYTGLTDATTCWLHQVLPDPLKSSGSLLTWARGFNTGQTYNHAGNVRAGDIEFLPSLTTAAYGQCVYVSGSAVRCWDGTELGDAGFQSYPKITGLVGAGGGSLSAGDYFYRVYAVRYNKQGERFESAAVTSSKITVTSSQQVTLTIHTLPCTNHQDVVLEVYRTEAGGTTYYYDGSINNSLQVATVPYVSTISDATLRTRVGDPHATGVGQAADIETWGPIGCAILANSGDRLWGAGGQVPPGVLQFSKLHNDGFGAGFDDLAGYEEVDTEGGTITSIIRAGDTTVALEKDRLFTIGGIGPDNFGSGQFGIPEIVLSDGATTHLGTQLFPMGSVYWGNDGPRVLTSGYQVINISLPVRPLAKLLTPTGCRVDTTRQEIIWYTAEGDALLWNYMGGNSRWARWSGLNVAAVSPLALVMTDGRVLYPSSEALGDGGGEFEFKLRSGLIQPDKVIAGGMKIRKAGIAGSFQGPHEVRARLFYDGAPCWSEEWTWQPQSGTYLALVDDYSTLTPAQVDALKLNNQLGSYFGYTRTKRNECAYVQIEISNKGAAGPTFIPTEITLEIGVAPGLARTNPNSFGG